jgi:hypothetical protein
MRNIHFLIIIILTAFLLSANDSWAGNWVLLGANPYGTEYYNPSDAKKVNKNIIRVRTKTIYNERGKFKNFSLLKKTDEDPRNPYVLSFEMQRIEFNCTSGKHRLHSGGIYDKRGNLIADLTQPSEKWSKVPAKSNIEKLKDIICGDKAIAKKNYPKNKGLNQ